MFHLVERNEIEGMKEKSKEEKEVRNE